MTKEEAITKLKSQRNVTCNGCLHAVGWCESHCKFSEAIDMAIEALKAEGTISDMISKTETIKRLYNAVETTYPSTDHDGGFIDGVEFGISIVSTMPPAQPERKKGKWMPQKGGGLCCSECGGYALDVSDGNFIHIAVQSNFCPHCGAKLKGGAG